MRRGQHGIGPGRALPLLCAVVLALPATAVADDLDAGVSVTCREQRVPVAQVDGVIITGLQHEFGPAFLREFWGMLHPANEEGGRFAAIDDGYLTSRPGQRHLYYRSEAADPKVIALDEATKGTT